MDREHFTDDLIFRPSLPALLISVTFWSVIGVAIGLTMGMP